MKQYTVFIFFLLFIQSVYSQEDNVFASNPTLEGVSRTLAQERYWMDTKDDFTELNLHPTPKSIRDSSHDQPWIMDNAAYMAGPVNDNYANAIDLSATINGACSSIGSYTNTGATADQSKASCWSGGPYKNVWFKFTATAMGAINVKINVNNAAETMRYPMVALWNTGLTTQLQCQNQQGYGNGTTSLAMSYFGLTPGSVYYIEVDNYTPWGVSGTFDICLSDVTTFDYPQGAVDLTGSINASCANGGSYTNQFATSDNSAGSCWSGGPYQNVWFKFTATSTGFINVKLNVNGVGETMRYPMVALWNTGRTVQLQCQNQQGYGYGSTNLSMSYYGLTPGTVYYIEVDNFTPWGASGTFDICLSDVTTFDYPQGAVDLTGSINASCATGGSYTNQFATSDNSAGSCWSGGPYQNVWFKFTATSTGFINVVLNVSNPAEMMRYPMIALWNTGRTVQLQCQNQQGYGNGSTNLSMTYYGLTPGAVYFIEVDNFTSWGPTGTFDICLNDNPNFDYPQGAIDLSSQINLGCSVGGAYTNQFATADDSKGSCWSGGPYQNVWFKFTATATGSINVKLNVGNTGETMRYAMVALWNSGLTSQLQCQNQQGYGNGASNLSLSYSGLTPGSVYYIEVDNYTPWGSTGSFDICLSDVPNYDFPVGAVDLTNSMNGCSTGGLYTNQFATADDSKGSCWSGGPYQNVWFKFTASSSGFINVQILVNSPSETMRYPMVALWNSGLTSQLQCQNQQGYGNGTTNLSMSYYGLTPGATYYIEVDNFTPWGASGTFDICVSNVPNFDFPQGAVTLTNLNNYCSSGGTYTNATASADNSKGSCWSGGPYQNVWFKFQAVNTTVSATVEVNGAGETMRYPMVALWNGGLTTQYACQNQAGYGSGTTNATINYTGLTIGSWYYIEVDNYTPWGASGSFDICINNTSGTQYYSRASGDWSNSSIWSTIGFTGPVAGSIPTTGNVVNIKDQTVTVSSVQNCQQLNITASAESTALIVNGSRLTVYGTFNQTNSGINQDMITTVQNGGTLAVVDNANFTRNGGSNAFQLNVNTGSSMTVGQDMIWTSMAGTLQNNQLNLNGTASLNINRDLTLSSTGGMLILHSLNNSATMSVGRDITFSASEPTKAEILLNNTSILSLQRNFVRNISSYGILNCGSNATLLFDGTGTSQNMLGSAGTGGDSFTYTNLTINNTSGYSPSVMLTGPASMSGVLTLSSGLLQTSSTNLLTLTTTASSPSNTSSSTSYIDGPMTIQVSNVGNTTLKFPIGKGADSRPVLLTVTHSNNFLYNYQAEVFNASAVALNYAYPPTVDMVSWVHYWTIGRTDNTGTYQPNAGLSGNQQIQLYFGPDDNVLDGSNLTIVKNTYNAQTSWIDIGGFGAPSYMGGTNLTGSVISTSLPSAFNSFSTFTLGDMSGGDNPLPVTLLTFKATPEGNKVNLNWITTTEIGGDYFTVEKSRNGIEYEKVAVIKMTGSNLLQNNYSSVDANPFPGTSYYRLKMTSINGTFSYSKVIPVQMNASVNVSYSVFPNPTDPSQNVFLGINGMETGKEISVIIYDILGKEIFEKNYAIGVQGMDQFNINPNMLLHSGLFIVMVKDASNNKILFTQKLLIR